MQNFIKARNLRFAYIFGFVAILLLVIFYAISELSISYQEAVVFFDKKSILHFLVVLSCKIFGQNDFALRLPFVLFYLISAFLMFEICKFELKRELDRYLCVGIFMILPGVLSSAILVNEAILVIFLSLLFVLMYFKNQKSYYILLIVCLFVDNSFAIFYLSLFFYGIFKKDSKLISLTLVLFTISMYLYGFDVSGKPKGYFLDTIGIYSAVFSPFVFLYFAYAIYRTTIKEKKDILYFIAFVSFMFALLFSLRQRLFLEDFLPFSVISLPIMIKVFLNSYRVRLPRHRKFHLVFFILVLSSLALNSLLTIFNKPLYIFTKTPKKHFVYKYHIAKELSSWLHKNGYLNINSADKEMLKRLEFYHINKGESFILKEIEPSKATKDDFIVKYSGKKVTAFEVKKGQIAP